MNVRLVGTMFSLQTALANAAIQAGSPVPLLWRAGSNHLQQRWAFALGARTLHVLHAVRALGMQVSLDDFGVGYCNFSCLDSLPAELLKLDQSLIKHIATDPRAWELLKSIIQFGHALGYQLLAEGVETAEVFDLLESSGCDAVQGYYLARPLEAPDLVVMLKRHLELSTLV